MDMPKLWIAILSKQYSLANQMIYRGADVNERTKTKLDSASTLLHYAVEMEDVQCIRALADLDADFNARDSGNRTPLHWTALVTRERADIAEILINEGAIVDARDNYQMTPLHQAARTNFIEVAQKLIARGASINAIGRKGLSVLHAAVIGHNLEMVKMLISHGVNIDAKDSFGCTPLLHYFTRGEHKTEITQLLLDNGADVNVKTPEGNLFSLLYAAKFNRRASLHLLLKRGARVNEATNTGRTALHVACNNGLTDVTALLLQFGADLNARNKDDKTPFELLPNCPSSEATAQIIIREAVKREALGLSLCEGYTRMVQSCENYSKFDQECREEIKRMQSAKIDIEDIEAVSFFWIFSMDEEKLTALARNEMIITAFESSGYMMSFKIYGGQLITKFEVAKERANLSAPIVRKIAAYVRYGYLTL